MPQDMFGYDIQVGDIVLTKSLAGGPYGSKGNLIPGEVIFVEPGFINIRVKSRIDLLSDIGRSSLTEGIQDEYLVKSTRSAVLIHLTINNEKIKEDD